MARILSPPLGHCVWESFRAILWSCTEIDLDLRAIISIKFGNKYLKKEITRREVRV